MSHSGLNVHKLSLLLIIAGAFVSCASAQAGIIFAQDSSGTTCIMQDDYLWMEIYSPVVSPSRNWLAQGKTGGFLVSSTVTSQAKGSATFSQMQQVGITNFSDSRRVILPLTMTPISRLDLNPDPDSQITKIDVAVKYIEQKEATAWGAGLQTFASLVSKLPIPPGPYSAAAQQISAFTDNLVKNSLQTEGLDSLPSKFSLGLNIEVGATANQRCPRFAEMGTYAIVDPSPAPNAAETGDYVDVFRPGDYCFYAEMLGGGQSIALKWQSRQSLENGSCQGTGTVHSLANDYVPLVLWSAPKREPQHANLPIGLMMRGDEVVDIPLSSLQSRTQKALEICSHHNISKAECLSGEMNPDNNQKLREYKQKFDLQNNR